MLFPLLSPPCMAQEASRKSTACSQLLYCDGVRASKLLEALSKQEGACAAPLTS